MANVRNYEEYRAEVLERLGDDYTVEDLRNTERWRLRVLDMLSGGGSGGGGSSDFSTAQVTFVNSSELQFNFIIPYAFDGEEETSSYGEIANDLIGSGTTINAILYKGYCFVSLSPIGVNTPNIEVSGDIEDMGHEDYLITGDCIITIS